MTSVCQDCGMTHEPDEPEKCIEGHGADPAPAAERTEE